MAAIKTSLIALAFATVPAFAADSVLDRLEPGHAQLLTESEMGTIHARFLPSPDEVLGIMTDAGYGLMGDGSVVPIPVEFLPEFSSILSQMVGEFLLKFPEDVGGIPIMLPME